MYSIQASFLAFQALHYCICSLLALCQYFVMTKIVIGGGIAGVCCAQELSRLHPAEDIVLVSAKDVVLEVIE